MALEQNVNNLKRSVTALTETVKTDLDAIQKFKAETAATIERLKREVSEASNTASDVEAIVTEKINIAATSLDRKFSSAASSLLTELKANAADIINQIRVGEVFFPTNLRPIFLVRRRFDDVATNSGETYEGAVERFTLTTGLETPTLDLSLNGNLPPAAPVSTGEFRKVGYISHGFEVTFSAPPESVSALSFRALLKGAIRGRIQHRSGPLATPQTLELSDREGSPDFPVELIVAYFPPTGPEANNSGLIQIEITPMSIGDVYTRVLEQIPTLPESGSYVFEVSKLNLKGKLLRYDQ